MNQIPYHQVEECDYEAICQLCTDENWSMKMEDLRYLCSMLPAASQVARSGGQPVGLYLYFPRRNVRHYSDSFEDGVPFVGRSP